MPDRVNRNAGPRVDAPAARLAWPWFRGVSPGSLLASPPWSSRCLGCGEAGADGRDLCGACHSALPRIGTACPRCGLPSPRGREPARGSDAACPAVEAGPTCPACLRAPPPLSRVVVPYLYAAPLDRWLPRFKFHQDLAVGRLLSQLVSEACRHAPRPHALVPVPLHHTRLRSRGYDQALELAKPMARALSLPLRTDLLQRVRATTAQSSLHAGDRHRNLDGAFAVVGAAAVRNVPAHVALVDDVMTTGSTLHAAARALLEAGVGRVDAWACARAP